jgi:hypothetical protein
MADDYYEEPSIQDKIEQRKKEMERIRERDKLHQRGYPVPKASHSDQDRLVTLSLEINDLEAQKQAQETEYWSSHDL